MNERAEATTRDVVAVLEKRGGQKIRSLRARYMCLEDESEPLKLWFERVEEVELATPAVTPSCRQACTTSTSSTFASLSGGLSRVGSRNDDEIRSCLAEINDNPSKLL